MRAVRLFGLAGVTAALALASPALAADDADKAKVIGNLLAQVCLPVLEDGHAEGDAARAAGLHRVHQIWAPQSPPRGLRRYAGASVVNMTDETCSLHVETQDFPAYISEVMQVLSARPEPWTAAASSADGQTPIFCDPSGRVALKTFEGDPFRFPAYKAMHVHPSFEVSVTTRGSVCHAGGGADGGAR